MEGIVSLLEGPALETVFDIWGTIRHELGFETGDRTGSPHLSYHVAERYDSVDIHHRLAALTNSLEPFHATATGVGLFPGSEPVVYIPVVRSDRLSGLHHRIWETVSPAAIQASAFYTLPRWLPHITIAQEGLSLDEALAIVRLIAQRRLEFPFRISHIAHLSTGLPPHILHLCGASPPPHGTP